MAPILPPGWSVEGQLEQGENGTIHYQAMLKTPQCRFSAVKAVFPRAHVEVARNAKALKAYVHKDETRVAEVAPQKSVNVYEYVNVVASEITFDMTKAYFIQRQEMRRSVGLKEDETEDEMILEFIDDIIRSKIEEGQIGLEFLAVNPIWRSVWKRFWRAIIRRSEVLRAKSEETDRQTDTSEPEVHPAGDEIKMDV